MATDSDAQIEPGVLQTWNLSPIKSLGGRINHHWLVERGGRIVVLRRFAAVHTDIGYELDVLRGLDRLGWPVPVALDEPMKYAGAWWCLFSHLAGSQTRRTGAAEQRLRGRLLAELHESTETLASLGQRKGFERTDTIVNDPDLTDAVRAYEALQPDVGHMMRWHIDRARACLEELDLKGVEQIVLHSDFTAWNLLFDDDTLSGVLDFESTHLDFRVADFALAWRGTYDDVVHGYEEIRRLSELDRQLLVPVFWGWLFRGVKEEMQNMLDGRRTSHGFDWQVKQLARRSTLFGEMADPYQR